MPLAVLSCVIFKLGHCIDSRTFSKPIDSDTDTVNDDDNKKKLNTNCDKSSSYCDAPLSRLGRFLRDGPIRAELMFSFCRCLTQFVINRLLSYVELRDTFDTVGDRRMIAQRLTRSFIGGIFGFTALSLVATNSDIQKKPWTTRHWLPEFLLRGLNGYFVADTLEIYLAHVNDGSPPQLDLVIHHIFGLVMNCYSLGYPRGNKKALGFSVYALLAEILTIFSGPVFLFSAMTSPRVAVLSSAFSHARLGFIIFGRFPLWFYLAYRTLKEYQREGSIMRKRDVMLSVLGFIFIVSIDTYWTHMLVKRAIRKLTKLV